jgi:hypothetical protein
MGQYFSVYRPCGVVTGLVCGATRVSRSLGGWENIHPGLVAGRLQHLPGAYHYQHLAIGDCQGAYPMDGNERSGRRAA